jgi:hypothetical protein
MTGPLFLPRAWWLISSCQHYVQCRWSLFVLLPVNRSICDNSNGGDSEKEISIQSLGFISRAFPLISMNPEGWVGHVNLTVSALHYHVINIGCQNWQKDQNCINLKIGVQNCKNKNLKLRVCLVREFWRGVEVIF